ncbi:MAG: FitA-like ribbon-helix-helix domain-containing protein [Desertimonas sp.]
MKTLQIRNVPDDVHRTLKARAALSGRSLSEFALGELVRAAQRPTLGELVERVERLDRIETAESPADAVRAERGAR